MSMEAAGFPCPMCECEDADILELELPQMELRCKGCAWEFAVEP